MKTSDCVNLIVIGIVYLITKTRTLYLIKSRQHESWFSMKDKRDRVGWLVPSLPDGRVEDEDGKIEFKLERY
jgi:hypothetical protein